MNIYICSDALLHSPEKPTSPLRPQTQFSVDSGYYGVAIRSVDRHKPTQECVKNMLLSRRPRRGKSIHKNEDKI